ncbi:DUF3954 domain-containing protein [Virgibacillus sp. Bac332]|uniref:DUF3954 domain-containing protein n=1 Tax=Virgibacillus sp. Bac332 TaxID=2419842 RepID=UPI000EF47F8E|nr:DUF3954 domain-containing protein [Virgibacillus sp. Bac332]
MNKEANKKMNEHYADVELSEDAVLVVKNGELRKYPKPDSGFGKHVINWNDGKIVNEEVRYTLK